ncbi:MAG: hypothetical protein KDN19_00565 [Verrucomicrobiae bacterium]|nr:hypothetical protein [Verrucomicrobiae bacterium]
MTTTRTSQSVLIVTVAAALAGAIFPGSNGIAGDSSAPPDSVAPALADSPEVSENLVDAMALSDVSLGGFLFPHLHAFGVFGDSTADDIDSLASGHHDPQREATLQSLEPSVSLRAGMLEGFATASGHTDAHGTFDFGLEEGFLKLVDLPLGIELRGGQFYNRFGFQNALHNHSWMLVDQNLVNGRFLQEGEMAILGGEATIDVPLSMMQVSAISVAVGGLPSHEHDHEHEHGEEAEFEAEGANFAGTLVTANWVNQYDINDMNRLTSTLSGAWGDNMFGRETQIYGLGFEYLWRENGYGAGGQSLRWRNELMYRHFGAVSGELHEHGHEEEDHDHEHEEIGHEDEHGHHEDEDHEEEDHEHEDRYRASLDEFGLYSTLVYGFNDTWETGVRAGWVSGIDEVGLDDRFRLSPMVTWYANPTRNLLARIQYNWDHSDEFGDEHSIWFQVGMTFGGPEVR